MKSGYAQELTPREREVIELLSTGLTNEEIARQLGISLDGAKYHVSGILRRLRVKNRHEAASLHLRIDGGVLTPRELVVIELLSTGLTNEEIARQLGISLAGVKQHVSGILRRLDVDSRREAASLHLSGERRSGLAAWAPVMFLRKLPSGWLVKVAAVGALTAAAAGIVLLAWGVLSTSSVTVTTTPDGVDQSVGNPPPFRAVAAVAAGGADAITAISAGFRHSCALKDGGVWCWGGYFDSDGVTEGGALPMAVPGLTSGVTAISSGIHSCALQHGGVWCWGAYSAYPDGVDPAAVSQTDATDARNGNFIVGVPVEIAGLTSGVSAISSGGGHSCALKGDGVWCWEQILYGGLSTGVRFRPAVLVPGLERGVTAISAGWDHSCALKDGGVWCWGHNGAGALGNNSRTDSDVAVAVSGLGSGVSAISAGQFYTCALKDSGVWCWGRNWEEQLGNEIRTDSLVPVAVSGMASGVSAISAGNNAHVCAVKDGGAWCWGDNRQGQLGNDSATGTHLELGQVRPISAVPVPVSGLASGVSAINGGDSHSCALKEDGVWCWGSNSEGQLGNNSTSDSPVPVRVLLTPPSAGDTAAAPDVKPLARQTSNDSGDHRGAYVLGATAVASLAIGAAGLWAMRRRRRSS